MTINSNLSFRLLRTMLPHTNYLPKWHVYDPEENSLATFATKTRAVAYISIQTGVLQETSPPFKDYAYIVYDRRGTREYASDTFCYNGTTTPDDLEIFHFIPVHDNDEMSPKLDISEIRKLAEHHKINLIGNNDKIEDEFHSIQIFFNRALDTKHDAFRYYPLTELADIIRIFTRQHLLNADKYFNHNLILLAAFDAGVHFKRLNEDEIAKENTKPVHEYRQSRTVEMQISGLYLPRVLTGRALDYTQEQFFQKTRFFKKRGPQNRRLKTDIEKIEVKLAKEEEIEREDYNGLTFWEHMEEVKRKVDVASAQKALESA